MNLIKKILCILLVPAITTGCITEDLDDCDNVSIHFRYDADGDTDVLSQYIDKIDLYVFNEGNQLVDIIGFGKDDLTAGADVSPKFRLTPGTYRLVAVGNAYGRTAVEGTGSADMATMYIQNPEWGVPGGLIDGHDHNYMGQKTITVPGNNRYLDETVYLYSSHINVSVEVHGLPGPESVTSYSLAFDGSNAQTDFNNKVNPDQRETCVPALDYDGETGIWHTEADLALFRMDDGGTLSPDLCRHVLRLTDGEGNTIAEHNIIDYIRDNARVIDVTRQEADLPISLNVTPLGVTIEVPTWYVEDVTPDWGD